MAAMTINMDEPLFIREGVERPLPENLANDAEFIKGLLSLSHDGRKFFEVKLNQEVKAVIRAQGFAGIFSLKDSKGEDVIVRINPKITITNLVWKLGISGAKKPEEVKKMENLISIFGKDENNVDLPIISVIRKYLRRLSEALTYGFLEMPRVEVEEGTVVRGRILSSQLPRTLFSSPSPRIAYEAEYYTVDNLVSQYILDTGYMLYTRVYDLLKGIGKDPRILFEDPKIIIKAILELGYSPSLSIRNVNILDLLNVIPLDRPYIYELLILTEIIRKWLKNEQPFHLMGFTRVQALYIDMSNFFENFVRNLMILAQEQLRKTGIDIIVKKGENNKQALVAEPEPGANLVPDIVVCVKDKPVAVGDVKYKISKDPKKPVFNDDRDSLYQLYTYMHGWNVDKGFLVYPATEEEPSSCAPYMLKDGKTLYIVKINTNELPKTSEEPQNSELFEKLLEFMKELVK